METTANGQNRRQRKCPARQNLYEASADARMLSESAIGRISGGATPASASAARYAEAPPWPTEAYMKAATSIPAPSSARTRGSICHVIYHGIQRELDRAPRQPGFHAPHVGGDGRRRL